jgi:hypothetical protein
MRTIVVVATLIAVSTGAFADDRTGQIDVYDVYDDVRNSMQPLPNAKVEEQVTALIKRYMANLLYPVDMSSFSRPDNDPKFRDLIIVLQQQMGAPPTGNLTMDQFGRLEKASRDIDRQFIGLPFSIEVHIGSEYGGWALRRRDAAQ